MQIKKILLTGLMVVILLSGCGRAGKNTATNSETISTATDTYNEQKTEMQTDKTQTDKAQKHKTQTGKEYFEGTQITYQHGGGYLFCRDKEIMGWLFAH